jgi:hypothetical protein
MRPGHRRARRQQDERVQQREVPGVESLNALRRPHASSNGKATDIMRVAWEQCSVEIGPEPGDEKHHFRSDEKDHPVAV